MRFVENIYAGRGVREFYNLATRNDRRPGHLDLGWAQVVRQRGTHETGCIECVEVVYGGWWKRRKRFRGREADRILRVVQEHRSDVVV